MPHSALSVAAGIRGRSHPRYAVNQLTAHTATFLKEQRIAECSISVAAGIRGRSHPR